MDNEAIYQIRKALTSYRANPDKFPVESRDAERMQQIRQLQLIDWVTSSKEHKPKKAPELVIIVDTEFFLFNMPLIAEIVDHLTTSVWFVLPWVMVKELDALKTCDEYLGNAAGKCVGDLALDAIYLIHHLLDSQHPSVVGQQLTEMYENQDLNVDRMLDCAVYFKAKVCPFLVLLAANREIMNKAPLKNVYVISEWRSSCAELLQSIAKSGSAKTEAGTSGNAPVLAANHEGKKTFNILIMVLPGSIITHFNEEFGNDFIDLVALKPPWTLADMFYLLRKHWLAVFSDHFTGRNKRDSEDRFKRMEAFCKRWESSGGSFQFMDSNVPKDQGIGKFTRIRAAVYPEAPERFNLYPEEIRLFIKDTIDLMEGMAVLQKEKVNYCVELRAMLQEMN